MLEKADKRVHQVDETQGNLQHQSESKQKEERQLFNENFFCLFFPGYIGVLPGKAAVGEVEEKHSR